MWEKESTKQIYPVDRKLESGWRLRFKIEKREGSSDEVLAGWHLESSHNTAQGARISDATALAILLADKGHGQ